MNKYPSVSAKLFSKNIADCPSVLLVPLFHMTQCVSQPRKC